MTEARTKFLPDVHTLLETVACLQNFFVEMLATLCLGWLKVRESEGKHKKWSRFQNLIGG